MSINHKRKAYAVLTLFITIILTVDVYRQLKDDMSYEITQSASTILQLTNYEPFNGLDYDVVNDNKPFFEDRDISTESFEVYGDLDEFGRCTVAYACLGLDTMPTEGEIRGDISKVHPTGWLQNSYSILEENDPNKPYLFERSHLIAWCLSDENDNERNLITGTKHMNATMWMFEQQVQAYIYRTGNHIMYRVTPEFREEKDMLPYGVTIEAYSVEDSGALAFCVFCYNNQDGIELDYATGDNRRIPQ